MEDLASFFSRSHYICTYLLYVDALLADRVGGAARYHLLEPLTVNHLVQLWFVLLGAHKVWRQYGMREVIGDEEEFGMGIGNGGIRITKDLCFFFFLSSLFSVYV